MTNSSTALVPANTNVAPTVADMEVIAADECRFQYDFLPVSDLRVEMGTNNAGKPVVKSVLVKDEPLMPTPRFWTSLYSRFGFNDSIHKYFSHHEVFDRISQVDKNDRMRLCIERASDGSGKLLGVSNPNKPIVVYDDLMNMLHKYRGEGLMYHNGIVESTHTPRNGGNLFEIAGDTFANKFMMSTPIDGYGAPNIYLSLLRQVCSNGMVGYAKTFKSALSLGKGDDDVTPSMARALDGFGNDEGYAALRQRVESAATSWLSVHEAQELYKLLVKLHAKRTVEEMGGMSLEQAPKLRSLLGMRSIPVASEQGGVDEGGLGSPIIKAYHELTGDTSKLYGLANLESLSAKRQKTLPVKCTVYDAINFTTEVSTHYAKPEGARMLQGWVGTLVTDEYDMEGTKDRFGDFADFLVASKETAGLTTDHLHGKGTGTHKGIVHN